MLLTPWNYYKRRPYDVLLLDIHMPELSGIELAGPVSINKWAAADTINCVFVHRAPHQIRPFAAF